MRKSRMSDVARLANVSTSTVSHVINGTRYVSEEVAARVNDAIRQLSYVPNQTARNLKTGCSHNILFVVPDISNGFFATVIDAVETELTQKGYRLVILNTKETPQREVMHLQAITPGTADGLLLASTHEESDDLIAELPAGLPAVLVDRTFDGAPLDTVHITTYNAVYSAVQKLIAAGHRRIGFISGLPRLSSTKERVRAYTDCMAANGLRVESGFIQIGDSMHSSSQKLCERLLSLGCSAMIVSNGVMAYDVFSYFQHRKEKPDASLVGFLDYPLHSYADDFFAAVRQPAYELGSASAKLLLRRIENPDIPTEEISLNAQLIIPGSDGQSD